MEQFIKISTLNDFIFCPASIYYHGIYEDLERSIFQEIDQIRGTASHKHIDNSTYSTSKEILQGIEVYSSTYQLIGKIDLYDQKKKVLIERKHEIKTIYDGYIYQLYAQYFALRDQGYEVNQLKLYSFVDNKSYDIDLPEKNQKLFHQFEVLIHQMTTFHLRGFRQDNREKCKRCIYAPLCVHGGEKL